MDGRLEHTVIRVWVHKQKDLCFARRIANALACQSKQLINKVGLLWESTQYHMPNGMR